MIAVARLLAVMLLTQPDPTPDVTRALAISADADRVEEQGPSAMPNSHDVRIRAARSDFDRTEGVAYFAGNVRVDYADSSCTMVSDRLFAFMRGTNALTRIVATGNVTITNDLRVGACQTAVYRHARGEIEMFGAAGAPARLRDAGEHGNAMEGSSIRFWLDSEQVEVKSSRLEFEGKGGRDLL